MAFRTIQVGDDLSGQKIYCNFPDNPSWFIGDYSDNIIIETTNGGIMHYQTGATHMEESIWVESPVGTRLQDLYSMWAYDVWVNEPYYICPDNFGVVTSVRSSSGIYPLLTISTGEIEDTIYYGTNRIEKIYYNGENILKIYPGGRRLGTFTLSNWRIFNFIDGQTWREWVTEKKYWTDEDNFGINQWDQVYYDGDATVCWDGPRWDAVDPDELIEEVNYSAARACLYEDTLIRTINGNVPIIDLKENDVLSQNNKIEKIIQHTRTFYYKISLNNGDIIKASNDHKFVLFDGAVMVTNKLKPNDKLTADLYIEKIELIEELVDMYEIKTTNNTYKLFNEIICECENI